VALSYEAVSEYDAVLIATDHDSIDYQLLANSAKILIDTRNVCARAGAVGSNIVKA
jgi:UDP-N-acetyl-D-glucosamine dehydrogenase